MKRIVLTLSLLVTSIGLFAQDEEKKEEPPKQGWTRFGNTSLIFNQAAFNNDWATGGINSTALDFGLSYDMNYLKGDLTWDNKFIASYGVAKIGDGDLLKTNDRLEINSLVGKKAAGYWGYSFFMNFKTQFDSGFNFGPDGEKLGRNSHFFSPAYLQLGPGMLWKKSDNLKVNISPATAKLIIVHDEFTEVKGGAAVEKLFNDAGGYFGVEANETTRFEFGASLQAYYKFNLMESISVENLLALYSNYLEDPQNVDIDYTMNLVMKVNKYISANLTFQAIYDDNAIRAFQIRETFGAGLNYKF